MRLVRISHRNGLKMQKFFFKITNNLQKHKLFKPSKSLAIIGILCIFISVFIYTNSTKLILNYSKKSFEPHLKFFGICYYANVLKEGKKKHKCTTQKTLVKKAFCSTNKTPVTR